MDRSISLNTLLEHQPPKDISWMMTIYLELGEA